MAYDLHSSCKTRLKEHDQKNNDYRSNITGVSKTYLAYCVQWMFILGIIAVMVSIPWEFMRHYQQAVARRASQIMQGSPSECYPESMTVYESLKSLLHYQFSWTHARSPCQEYYYASLVDPLWEVTPVVVVTSVLTRCFLHPLELICGSMGQSLQLFLSEIPAQYQPLFVLVSVMASFVFLLMVFSYRLSVPLLLRLESNHSAHMRSTSYPGILANKASINASSLEKDASLSYGRTDSKISSWCQSLPSSSYNSLNLCTKSLKRCDRQKRSDNKNLLNLSSSEKTCQGFRSLGQNYLVKASGEASLSRTLASEVNTRDVLGRSKADQVGFLKISSLEQQLNIHKSREGSVQTKYQLKTVGKRRAKQDSLWKPTIDEYELSD